MTCQACSPSEARCKHGKEVGDPELLRDLVATLEDYAKLANNVGVIMGSNSSEPNTRRREKEVEEQYRKWNITSPRVRDILDRARAAGVGR